MVDVRVGDHSIMNQRSFTWVTWRRCRSDPVIQQKAGTFGILEDDADVSNFIPATKIVESQTGRWRFFWICLLYTSDAADDA